MASVLEELGISQEVVQSVEPEDVYEGKTIPSGLYDAVVDKAYIRKTDSGAKMLEIDFELVAENGSKRPFHYSTAIASGDQKGNKTTYTSKQGKELPLPGVISLTKFLQAINSVDAQAQKGEVEHNGTKMEVLAFKGLQGKKLKLGINQYENFYNGEVSIRNDVKYWLDAEGKNSEGKDITDKVKESLEKFPLKKLKNQPSAGTMQPSGSVSGDSEVAASGW